MPSTNIPKDGGARRKQTLIRRAYELGKCPGIKMALFIRRQGKITTYQSIDDESWWPVMAEIVCLIFLQIKYITNK
jgi:hypothetical protein